MTQEQIYRMFSSMHLRMKGLVDLRIIGRYSFVMLFLKYVTDCWNETYVHYRQLYGDEPELFQRKMSRERFVLSENASFYKIVAEKHNPDLGYIINRVLFDIEQMNPETMKGIFDHVDFNSDYELGDVRNRNQFLQELVSRYERLDLRPSNSDQKEHIAAAIGGIGTLGEITNANGGEFFTPADICTLVVRLLKPAEGEQVYDPLCGSGGFLIAAAREVEEHYSIKTSNYGLYGQEINKQILAWARMNAYLAGLDNFQLAEGDVLRHPVWTSGSSLTKFDVVVSNLPFSSSWDEHIAYEDPYSRFKWGIPPPRKGEYAFIQHIIASAKNETGRMAMIVPMGILFRGGREASIREGIIKENLVEAVIALPSNLLYNTSVPCAILILNKGKSQNKNVLFIDASGNFEPSKYRNKLRGEDLSQIINTYRQFKENTTVNGEGAKSNFSRVVTLSEIADLEYNLNVSNYIAANKVAGEEEVDISSLKDNIAALQQQSAALQAMIQEGLKELGL